jgi:hypothetical protein
VKRLQQQWKEVGAAPRDQEQRLWNEFRDHCDAVYQKRQQAHAEYAATLEANKVQAVALCEEAEAATGQSGPALIEGVGKIPQWRAAFEALGEMPRAEQRALHDRFERAFRLCQSNLLRQRTRDKEQSFANLLEAARHIHAHGWAAAQAIAPADRDSLKQAADTFIAGVQLWPKGGTEALEQAWATAKAATGPDASAHETELRMLCIRSEILTDLPTPPEDQALRREYQMQRLVRHMGQREAGADELDALALAWVPIGPVPAATHQTLLARFLRCRRGT